MKSKLQKMLQKVSPSASELHKLGQGPKEPQKGRKGARPQAPVNENRRPPAERDQRPSERQMAQPGAPRGAQPLGRITPEQRPAGQTAGARTGRHGSETQLSIKRYERIGFALLVVLVFGFGGWSAFASISGAIIATGQVAVESNTKKIQHLEGGIVKEILVREGDLVGLGQPLIRLDGTETRVRLGIVRSRIDELTAKQARLETERDNLDEIAFPLEISYRINEPAIAKIVTGQKNLLKARRDSANGQRQQLHERIAQLEEEIVGLEAQQAAKEKQSSLIGQELTDLKGLQKQGLVPTSRVLALERQAADLEGERGQLVAQVARIKGRITETRLQIIQIDQEARTEVLNEIRDVETQLAELTEQRVAAEAQLRRVDIVAPQSGYVHELIVHTVGGVIGPGQDLMNIVPLDEEFIVDAKLDPRDIDQVTVGQSAVARFSAFDQRSTPELEGTVKLIAADLTEDPATGAQYYSVHIEFSEGERERLGESQLVPGMPAEIFIATGARTPMNYLLKPLTDQISHAFRQ